MKFIPISQKNWKDILPKNVDFSIDGFTKVTDKRYGSLHKKDSS
jgi:hypothetical protein